MSQESFKQFLRFFKISYIVPVDNFLTILLVLYVGSLLPYGVIHMLVGNASFFYLGLVFATLVICSHIYDLLFELSGFQKFILGFILCLLHFGLLAFLCLKANEMSFIWIWFYPGCLIFYSLIHPFFATVFNSVLFVLLYTTFSSLLTTVGLTLFLSIHVILIAFAHVVSFKICTDKEKLGNLMLTDNITGLKNRLALKRMILNSKIPWFFREIKSIRSVIYFDIDELKKIDDIYGHSINDIVMQRITKLVQKNIKNTKYFYRYSGRGFILFSKKGKEIIEEAQRLRQLVYETCIFDKSQSITISCGVAFKEDHTSIETIMLEAYKALLKSKRLECEDCICLPESDD